MKGLLNKCELTISKVNSEFKKYIDAHFVKNEQLKYWLELITIISYDQNCVNVAVANEFVKDFILEKHFNDIQIIFQEFFDNTSITYKIFTQEVVAKTEESDEVIPKEKIPKSVNRAKKRSRNWNVINHRYVFDNFIVGKNNEFAYNIAKNIADNYKLSTRFNPFIIYSPTGLGKSHLVQSIFIQIKRDNRDYNVLYTTGELFLQEYMDFIKKKSSTYNFEDKYKDVEILIIDDIQIFERIESVQKKFSQIYKNLIEKDKKIILTLDRPIEKLKFITTDFVESVKQGAIIDITYPDFENRVAILKHKAKVNHKIDYIPEEIFLYIASVMENTNIRALEGALNKVVFSHKSLSMPLTVSNVKELVKPTLSNDSLRTINDNLSMTKIVETVAYNLGVKDTEILGKSRSKNISLARHLSAYIIKEFTDLPNEMIGEFFNKNQASIAYSVNNISLKLKSNDSKISYLVNEISKQLM